MGKIQEKRRCEMERFIMKEIMTEKGLYYCPVWIDHSPDR